MGLEWSRPAPPCGSTEPNNQFDIVSNVHYLHFAIILAACFVAVAVPVSLLTKPRSPGEVSLHVKQITGSISCVSILVDLI